MSHHSAASALPLSSATRRRAIPGVVMSLLFGGVHRVDAPASAQAIRPDPAPTIRKEARPLDPNRLETGGAPVIMADTDLGFGIGGMISRTRFARGVSPFRWQLQALVFLTMKSVDDQLETVFHDHFIRLDLPSLAGGRLRLTTTLAFSRRSNASYYGIGNESAADRGADVKAHQFDRIYPQVMARALVKLHGPLSLMLGGSFTYNWINIYEGSRLQRDLQSGDRVLLDQLHGTGSHAMVLLDTGLVWDTRDHELIPSRGVFHEVSLRFTPHLTSEIAHGGATVALRLFRSLVGKNLVFAARVLGDVMWGNAPVYELARHGGLSPMPAPGGGSGIRGVPVQRYHGKIKLVSNWELRARILPFSIKGRRLNLGAVAFFDAGRIWADFDSPGRFDGDGPGIKYGLGGGARLQWGEAFMLRLDLAWSPDADPIGLYFNINHVF